MNTVFDINEMPNRRLHVRQMVALHNHMNIGEGIHIVKHDMAMKLAHTILDSKDFFNEIGSLIGGISYLEYNADCIVLTREEYVALKRQSFTDGVEHARGFMRIKP